MTNFIKNNAKYLTVGGAFTLLVVCYFQQKELSKLRTQTTQTTNTDSLINVINTLQNERDSLDSENFPCQIELSRYQNAYKIFLNRDPQGAKIYGDIISDETE